MLSVVRVSRCRPLDQLRSRPKADKNLAVNRQRRRGQRTRRAQSVASKHKHVGDSERFVEHHRDLEAVGVRKNLVRRLDNGPARAKTYLSYVLSKMIHVALSATQAVPLSNKPEPDLPC